MEFVNGIREDVRKNGCSEQDYYVKVRPEDRGGEIRIRADVKEKNGGRWQMKAIWSCPPLNRDLWVLNEDLYAPVVVGGGGGADNRNMSELATDGAQVGRRGGGEAFGKGGSRGVQRIQCTVQSVTRGRSYGVFMKRILLNRREDEPERNVKLSNVPVVKVVSYNLISDVRKPIYLEGAVDSLRQYQEKLKCIVSFRKYVITGYCLSTAVLVQTGEEGINVYNNCNPCL
jgi:hypothetical protein